MAWLAAAAPYITAASTALAVGSQIQQGKRQKSIAELAARDKEKAANEAAAESQREAQLERKKAERLSSRARAVAGASGAGVSDLTTTEILTDIDAQGEVNALGSLYSGDYYAKAMKRGAQVDRNEGKARQTSSYMSAASTALSGGSSWYDKYGDTVFG